MLRGLFYAPSAEQRAMTDSDEITKLLAESKELLKRIEAILNEQRSSSQADTKNDEAEPPTNKLNDEHP